MTAQRWLGSLGWRLLAAFVTVAVAAVAVLAAVAALSVDRRSATLAAQQRSQLRNDIASALAAAYSAGQGTWTSQNLAALTALAHAQGLQITVVDEHGRPVETVDGSDTDESDHNTTAPPTTSRTPTRTAPPAGGTTSHHDVDHPSTSSAAHDQHSTTAVHETSHEPEPDGHHIDDAEPLARLAAAQRATTTPQPTTTPGPSNSVAPSSDTATIPIIVAGRQVGSARFTFPTVDPAPVDAARSALLRQVAIGAGLAVLVAVLASAFVARRVSRPLLALTGATRAFAAGDTHPDPRLRTAPGELGELGRAFTDMADVIRRQEELRRAVVADVAHELRTPVTILRGQTEQLLDGLAEPTPERIVSLHEEILRLGRLTDDLAALAAADAAGFTLHAVPVELTALIGRTVEAIRTHLEAADLDLRVDVGEPIIVHGDSERLTQVLMNLLTNAAKFTPPGGAVTVRAARDGTDATITVTDTGPGIPADELPHVFERFWRGRAAGTRSGSGVGLAVVAALVTAHGGTVNAESDPSGGTRFTVRLPTTG